MHILAIVQGEWGKRKVRNIRQNGPSDWVVNEIIIPPIRLPFIDEPEEFIPENIPRADLLLSLGEEPALVDIIPDIVRRSEAKAVIAPVDNRDWLPAGRVNQLKKDLTASGIDSVFPVPFCSLTESDSNNEYITLFTKYFGKPILTISCKEGKVSEVIVNRDAPCGDTRYVAKQIIGLPIRDVEEKAGLIHHYYPCLSTMKMDDEFCDTLMHRSGLMVKIAVHKAIKSSPHVGEG